MVARIPVGALAHDYEMTTLGVKVED